MNYIADLHIHSRYSRATSKNLTPENLDYWARLKGINVMGTGDCIHPAWSKELKEKLEPVGNGFYQLKKEFSRPEVSDLKNPNFQDVYFVLTGELSSIYKKNGKVRKVHNVAVFPDFSSMESVQRKLDKVANIRSDGRPILGIDSYNILQMVLNSNPYSFLFPAHIWTPWFSVLGSKSGFDSLDECYDDLTSEIFAVESGLSSDPTMNFSCSILDKFKIISNSDAHSLEKLGREANLFDCDLSYEGMYRALKEKDAGFQGTIEFYPQEGKYHYDGHRNCDICWDPVQTLKHRKVCPVCGREVTVGVMYRVAELADRQNAHEALNYNSFNSIIPLVEILAEIMMLKSTANKRVKNEFMNLLKNLGPEFHILLNEDLDKIENIGGTLLAEAIRRLRHNEITVKQGYDGVFGQISVFSPQEILEYNDLFNQNHFSAKNVVGESIQFKIDDFKDEMSKLVKLKKTEILQQGPIKKIAKTVSLTDEQEKCSTFYNGVAIVLAGPGSGKTKILTERISYLLKEKKIPIEQILALTFSRKAAGEISERVAQKVKAKKLPQISTFHALGLSILQDYYQDKKGKNDFYLADTQERISILMAFVNDDRRLADQLLKEISLVKQGVDNDENIAATMNLYQQELKKRNALDLDDLVYQPVQIFNQDQDFLAKYQNKFSYLLIDEFQDINAIQYELIKLLSDKKKNLFVIGDVNQAIYAFRGADVHFIDKVKDDFPNHKLFTLTQSFRCPENILKAATEVLSQKKVIAGNESKVLLQMQNFLTDKQEAEWIATKIESMLGGLRSFSVDSGITDGNSISDSLGLADFAILCRSSFMFEALKKSFNDHAIPFQVIGNLPFYLEDDYRDILIMLRSFYYNYDDNFGFPQFKEEIVKMINEHDDVATTIAKIAHFKNFSELETKKIVQICLPYADNYEDFFQEVMINTAIDTVDLQVDAVKIMTMHASKGLEFECVFIPGCEEGIIPFNLFQNNNQEHNAEEERLLYVAMTRSQQYLFLTYALSRTFKNRTLRGKQSTFVQRIHSELLKIEKLELKEIKAEETTNYDQLTLF